MLENPLLKWYFTFWEAMCQDWNGFCWGPRWATPNKIFYENKSLRLRIFTEGRGGTPIKILSPRAGHPGTIVDYAEGQSLVQTTMENSSGPVFALEWKSADWTQRNETLDDMVFQTYQCLEKIGEPTIPMGICQGGWLAAICCSLTPELLFNPIILGAPIDFKIGGGKLQEWINQYGYEFYDTLINMGGGLALGINSIIGFKNMNPGEHYAERYFELYKNIFNVDFLQKSRRLHLWYEHPENMPGKAFLQIIKWLFIENRLIKGELEALGQKVDLRNIRTKLTLVGGEEDDITLIPMVFSMADYVSTPAHLITKVVVPKKGHIGLFMSHEAQKYVAEIVRNHVALPMAA